MHKHKMYTRHQEEDTEQKMKDANLFSYDANILSDKARKDESKQPPLRRVVHRLFLHCFDLFFLAPTFLFELIKLHLIQKYFFLAGDVFFVYDVISPYANRL